MLRCKYVRRRAIFATLSDLAVLEEARVRLGDERVMEILGINAKTEKARRNAWNIYRRRNRVPPDKREALLAEMTGRLRPDEIERLAVIDRTARALMEYVVKTSGDKGKKKSSSGLG